MSGLTRRGFKELSLQNVKSEQLITCDLPVAGSSSSRAPALNPCWWWGWLFMGFLRFSETRQVVAVWCSSLVHSRAAIVPRTLVSWAGSASMISLSGDHQDSDKLQLFYVPVDGWQEKWLPASFVLYGHLWPFQLAHLLTNVTAFLYQDQEWSCI